MAESADILAQPGQKVILPNLSAGCSMADMANIFQVRACWKALEKAGWSNADHWLRLQTAHDLAQAREHQDQIKVKRYEHHPAL